MNVKVATVGENRHNIREFNNTTPNTQHVACSHLIYLTTLTYSTDNRQTNNSYGMNRIVSIVLL